MGYQRKWLQATDVMVDRDTGAILVGAIPSTAQSVFDLLEFPIYHVEGIEDVVWDGSSNPDKERGAELCLTESPPSFRNLHRFLNLAEADADTTDSADHRCDLEELAPLEF